MLIIVHIYDNHFCSLSMALNGFLYAAIIKKVFICSHIVHMRNRIVAVAGCIQSTIIILAVLSVNSNSQLLCIKQHSSSQHFTDRCRSLCIRNNWCRSICWRCDVCCCLLAWLSCLSHIVIASPPTSAIDSDSDHTQRSQRRNYREEARRKSVSREVSLVIDCSCLAENWWYAYCYTFLFHMILMF